MQTRVDCACTLFFTVAALASLFIPDGHSWCMWTLRSVEGYCALDMLYNAVWPAAQPGPVRWWSVMLHHALVVYCVETMRAEWQVRMLVVSTLVEFSSFALNLHRLVRARWTQLLSYAAWGSTRLLLQTILLWYAFAQGIRGLDLVSLGAFPSLSYMWTAEALGLVRFRKWKDAPETFPLSSCLLLLASGASEAPLLYSSLVFISTLFHSHPHVQTFRRVDAALVSFVVLRELSDDPRLAILGGLLSLVWGRARDLVVVITFADWATRAVVLSPVFFIGSASFALMLALRDDMAWGPDHHCDGRCYVWHANFVVMLRCLRV